MMLLYFNCFLLRHPIEPGFTPPKIDCPWAKHPLTTEFGSANNALKDHGRRLKRTHLACFFVDKFFNEGLNAIDLPAIGNQFCIEHEPAI